ncbi:ABC transporter permease [Kitasatospora sp. NPDC059648]|uniref:ABC transporter permease n=1 Tax=Kitasatospora sp. NPDC059648 TaxID=3346894 RepID=UPI0036AD8444
MGNLTVGAISKPPAGAGKDGGSWEVSLDTLNRFAPEAQDFTLYLNTVPGVDHAKVQAALDSALASYPQVAVQSQADYKKQVTGQVDTILYLVYALLGLAIVIAVLGVINTLALSVIERTREIGLLRAVGAHRAQIGRMIRLESLLIAVHGALLGPGLGLAWGITGQKILALYGITALSIPWTTPGCARRSGPVRAGGGRSARGEGGPPPSPDRHRRLLKAAGQPAPTPTHRCSSVSPGPAPRKARSRPDEHRPRAWS